MAAAGLLDRFNVAAAWIAAIAASCTIAYDICADSERDRLLNERAKTAYSVLNSGIADIVASGNSAKTMAEFKTLLSKAKNRIDVGAYQQANVYERTPEIADKFAERMRLLYGFRDTMDSALRNGGYNIDDTEKADLAYGKAFRQLKTKYEQL